MKTVTLPAAVALLTLLHISPALRASDLSVLFRTLETTRHNRHTAIAGGMPRQAPQPVGQRLLLGAWLTDAEGRLKVADTVPGSPAHQTLQPGDVLCRITVPGGRPHTLRTLHQFEYAKREIGPHRQCLLDVYRPGTGMMPLQVTFESAGRLAGVTAGPPPSAVPTSEDATPSLSANR